MSFMDPERNRMPPGIERMRPEVRRVFEASLKRNAEAMRRLAKL